MAEEALYFVVKNHEEQYSVWPKAKPFPAGWESVGEAAPKAECLSRIEELWTDMRPLSVRKHIEATAGNAKARVPSDP